jgi:hypothetical protein
MKVKMISLNKKIHLQPCTPSNEEWAQISMVAEELGLAVSAAPEHGYRYAPQISFDGVKGYVQKHICAWQTKQSFNFEQAGVTIRKGIKCQLQHGQFVTAKNYAFTIDKEHTSKFLKPMYELFLVIGDRKISLTQIEDEIEKHPELKGLIKETFFNKGFYE